MSLIKQLSAVYDSAKTIFIEDSSKIVIMSDCHRGIGNWGDNFLSNQNLFYAALTYYYQKDFTYIELGDGDELWENRNFQYILTTHVDAFWLMSKFYKKQKLYMLYGNHDIVKRNKQFADENLRSYYDENRKKYAALFPGIEVLEGLILNYKNNNNIFLVHGHQVDFLNNNIWRVSRFLVRYLWRPLELIGVHDPTSASKNYKVKEKVEKRLIKWSKINKQMIIAGHTHRPVFPQVTEPLYFNDGSCVHPRCITAIEIENGSISLLKWTLKTKKDRTLFVGKEILEGPVKLQDFFDSPKKA
jgi:UDP-2,3-diacylglucosamine pyrophosphatase LpxH